MVTSMRTFSREDMVDTPDLHRVHHLPEDVVDTRSDTQPLIHRAGPAFDEHRRSELVLARFFGAISRTIFGTKEGVTCQCPTQHG